MRCGLITKKIGMTRVFDEEARQIPVTVLRLENCRVVSVKKTEKDGYEAVCLGYGIKKPSRVNKAQRIQAEKNKDENHLKSVEFRVSTDCSLPIGSQLDISHFLKNQFVDATSISQGKGFAGAMKRHNFGGLRASHGVTVTHRSHGSTGMQGYDKVLKGKRMAGHMGSTQVTIQNLIVHDFDAENGLILVKGAVPGPKGSWVYLKDAVKKEAPKDLPFPAGLKKTAETKAIPQESGVQE